MVHLVKVIIFTTPYAHNILPLSWSVPANQDNSDIGFDFFQSSEFITTPSNNSIGLPAQGAHVNVPADGYKVEYTFLVPDNKDLVV